MTHTWEEVAATKWLASLQEPGAREIERIIRAQRRTIEILQTHLDRRTPVDVTGEEWEIIREIRKVVTG